MTDMTAIARGETPIGDFLDASRAPQAESQLDVAVEAAQFAASALRAHRANGLIARLAPGNLGGRLNPGQVDLIVAFVAMLEGAPQQPQLLQRAAPGDCREPHSADRRCFDCATDSELRAAIPPYHEPPQVMP